MIRKLTGVFTASIFCLLLLPSLAFADTVIVENNTGQTIVELYISNADTGSWEEDVLDRDTLAPGDSVRVDLGRNYMMYDMKAVFDNDSNHTYTNINVRKYSNVRLNRNDADLW